MSVELRTMRPDEYPGFAETSRVEYAEDMIEHAGMDRPAAEAKADRDFTQVLPEGLETAGHWIFVVEADGHPVGRLWFAERVMEGRTFAFLYDVHIDAGQRGRGYGRAAMAAFEREAERRGLKRLALNVWGGNRPARSLYLSMGYVETAVQMAKQL